MILAWVLYSLVIGLLCAVAASACERVVSELGRPLRWVWAGAIALTIGLSISGFVRTRDTGVASAAPHELILTASETPVSSAPSFLDATIARVRVLGGMTGGIVASGSRAARSLTGAAYVRFGVAFPILWLAASAGLLLLLGFTFVRMWRARSAWRAHHIGQWPVLVSQDSGPALVGLIDSVIVVPAWLLEEADERQVLVVRHEREHQRAGDHFLLTLMCVAVCVLPWNPALWWMLKRARLAVELDCDARVLRSGAGAKSYGMLLLDIAGHASAARPFTAPALVDARTQLERRVLAMVEQHRTGRPLRALACATLALTLGVAACATDLPTAAQIDDLDVAQAREHAIGTGIMEVAEGETPVYVVDGIIVSEEVARGIPADDIESIEVLRKEAATRALHQSSENGAMLVRTRSQEPVTVTGEPAPDGPSRLRLRAVEVEVPAKVDASEVEVQGVRRRVNPTEQPAGLATHTPSEVKAGEEARLRSTAASRSAPLIVVDGKVAAGTFEMRQLDSGSIESIEVVKGEAARRLYNDPRAANGVVNITTKRK